MFNEIKDSRLKIITLVTNVLLLTIIGNSRKTCHDRVATYSGLIQVNYFINEFHRDQS